MTTEVVKQHCGMDVVLPKLSVESFHGFSKNLSCHPCCLVTEVPEYPLLACFLLEASWLLCIANEELDFPCPCGIYDDQDSDARLVHLHSWNQLSRESMVFSCLPQEASFITIEQKLRIFS